jgi:hypothetical protein
MCSGLALSGFTAAGALIPIYPEMIDYAKTNIGDNSETINRLTGLYGTAFTIGHIAGPYIGA